MNDRPMDRDPALIERWIVFKSGNRTDRQQQLNFANNLGTAGDLEEHPSLREVDAVRKHQPITTAPFPLPRSGSANFSAQSTSLRKGQHRSVCSRR